MHLEAEVKDCWFSHFSHARVTTYVDFIQRLKNKFGRRKPETFSIKTLPIINEIAHEEPKEYVIIITPEEEPLPPPPAT